MSPQQLSLLEDTPAREWNPYFVAYARSLGMQPEDIAPGAPDNVRYVAWIRGRRAEWAGEHADLTGGIPSTDSHLWPVEAHSAFDEWVCR